MNHHETFKVFIFSFSLLFDAVKLFEYDMLNQTEFLKKQFEEMEFWKNELVLTKKIRMDCTGIFSINILLQELDVKTLHECV